MKSSADRVYAAESMKAKTLKLVPGAYSCKAIVDKDAAHRFPVLVRVPTGARTYALNMPTKHQDVVPAWFVRHADTADAANMEVQVARSIASGGTKARQILVDVPYLINKKDLRLDEELLLPPILGPAAAPKSHKRKNAAIVLSSCGAAGSSSSSKRPRQKP